MNENNIDEENKDIEESNKENINETSIEENKVIIENANKIKEKGKGNLIFIY
jgi:hypothetical protein